jgi:hypothetical protein
LASTSIGEALDRDGRVLGMQGARATASAVRVLECQVPDAVSRRLLVHLAQLGDPATRLAQGLAAGHISVGWRVN